MFVKHRRMHYDAAASYGFAHLGLAEAVGQAGISATFLSELERAFRVGPLTGRYSHQAKEFIYVMSGTLETWLDELHCFVLQTGDSFWFESTHGHRWFNPGETEAAVLWINTPPTL